MSAHSKKAWLAFGLCLTAAGTAYAAIPDANGVIHGCYNVLSGSARIIDGNSCGLLERAITWAQTGPQGPAGPQGPQGPQGPAGTSNLLAGHTFFQLDNPLAPKQSTLGYATNETVTAPSNGSCAVTYSGIQTESTGQLTFRPVIKNLDTDRAYMTGQTAVLTIWDDPNTGSDFKQQAAGTVMDTFDLEAGDHYQFGASLQAAFPITQVKPVFITVSWVCTFSS